MVELDGTDRRVLDHLQKRGRDSYRDIARSLHISPATVMKRVKRLEAGGIITGYGAFVDLEKVGFNMHVIVDVRVANGKLHQIEGKIAKHPNVLAVYDNTGPFDSTVIASFKKRSDLDRFLKRLQGYDFVERTETKLILNTIQKRGLMLGR